MNNEAGSKVEADVGMSPWLSLFCREENRDGNTYVPYALHSYRSTATPSISEGVYYVHPRPRARPPPNAYH